VTTPVLIKQRYMKQYPDCVSENTLAVVDIETDVNNGTDNILMSSITFKDKAFIAITKEFLGSTVDVVDRTQMLFQKYLDGYIKKRNITLEVKVVDTPGQAAFETIMKVHEWKPDFISIWNID